jgi:hypothetical protein
VRHIHRESHGPGERASSHQAMSTTITTRQIDPICAPPQMSVTKLMADHNGGDVRGLCWRSGYTV